MQKHILDWYRIINPDIDESTLQLKKKAIDDVVKKTNNSDSFDFLYECIEIICCDEERINPKGVFIQLIIESFKSIQISFPTNVTEISMELKIICGIIIEDIITQENDENESKNAIASSVIQSVLGLKVLPQEKHLVDRIQKLRTLAEQKQEKRARNLRHREPIDLSYLENTNETLDAGTWANISNEIYTTFSELELQAKADREEVELLWWLQNEESKILNQSFSSLSPLSAAIYSGIEVANLSIYPPLQSTCKIVTKALTKNRKSNSLIARELADFLIKKEFDTWVFLTPETETFQKIVRNFPLLFPLTWLGMRINDTKMISESIFEEFFIKTGISSTQKLSPLEIGSQVYRETIAKISIEEKL